MPPAFPPYSHVPLPSSPLLSSSLLPSKGATAVVLAVLHPPAPPPNDASQQYAVVNIPNTANNVLTVPSPAGAVVPTVLYTPAPSLKH